jgi:hypothetical protein
MAGKHLTRDEIKALDDLKVEDVEIPEWGGVVRFREMTSHERLEWIEGARGPEEETEAEKTKRGLAASARLVALTAINEDGARKFKSDDVEWLLGKSPAALDKGALVALRLSGIGRDAEIAGKENSNETASGSS